MPCLRTSDIKQLHIDTQSVKQILPSLSSQYSRSVLKGGEVLVNVRGTLGGVATVPAEMRGWNISREVAVIPIRGISPEFIALWIASPVSQDWLGGVVKGVAYTGINIADLRKLAVPVPPNDEQTLIVERITTQLQRISVIEGKLNNLHQQFSRLEQAILAQAFRGELMPQDPADEPASALLERVRAERSAQTGAKLRRARRGQG